VSTCTGITLGDIGYGVIAELRFVDGVLHGVEYRHPHGSQDIIGVLGWIPVQPEWPDGWVVVCLDPLTLSPSVLCRSCGHHGFIRNGRWEPA
jgi:hypothetical protein